MTARRRSTHIIATSLKDAHLARTVVEQRTSSDEADLAASRLFHRQVYGLLVLQYSAILVIASPFALLPSVQQAIQGSHMLHTVLEVIAVGGIVGSLALAVTKGSKYPITQVCLVSITLFVSLEMGISFADGSLGTAGYIAIAQATSSFALVLALMQFDFDWLTYPAAFVFCFVAALLWVGILFEQGYALWPSALGIGMGGYAFVCIVLYSSYTVQHHVAPEEYMLATLFILCPEALLCVGAKERHVDEPEENGGENQPLV